MKQTVLAFMLAALPAVANADPRDAVAYCQERYPLVKFPKQYEDCVLARLPQSSPRSLPYGSVPNQWGTLRYNCGMIEQLPMPAQAACLYPNDPQKRTEWLAQQLTIKNNNREQLTIRQR